MAEMIELTKLKPHPKNAEIYGKEDVSELVESIKQFGVKNPIVVNDDNIIISGHRRYLAAKELGLKEIPFEIWKFDSPEDEIETLVLDNFYRAKTAEQKTREGLALEAAVSEKAKKRMAQGGKGGLDKGRENSSHPSLKGRTRDEVAKKVGIGSGKQYDNNKKVIILADKLREDGREQDATLITEVMNESPSTAYSLVTKVGVDNLTQENKDDLKSGKVSANALVQQKSQGKSNKEIKTINGIGIEQPSFRVFSYKLFEHEKNKFMDFCLEYEEKEGFFENMAVDDLKKFLSMVEDGVYKMSNLLDVIEDAIEKAIETEKESDKLSIAEPTSQLAKSEPAHEEKYTTEDAPLLSNEELEDLFDENEGLILSEIFINDANRRASYKHLEQALGLANEHGKLRVSYDNYVSYMLEYDGTNADGLKKKIQNNIMRLK